MKNIGFIVILFLNFDSYSQVFDTIQKNKPKIYPKSQLKVVKQLQSKDDINELNYKAATDFSNKASELLHDNDPYNALESINKALNLFPDDYIFNWVKAKITYQLEDYVTAIKCISVSIDKGKGIWSDLEKFYYLRAVYYSKLGKYSNVLLDLNKSIEIKESADVIFFRAQIKEDNLKDLRGANEDYNLAIKLFPEFITSDEESKNKLDNLWDFAIAYEKIGLYSKAEKQYIEAIKINNLDYNRLFILGGFYETKMHNKAKACYYYNQSCKLDPDPKCKDIVDRFCN